MGKTHTVIYRKRAVVPPPQITERDAQILHALNRACYLTTTQIQQLFWPQEQSSGETAGKQRACLARLYRLTNHGYIRRIRPFFRRGDTQPPYIYALDKRGAETVAHEMGVSLKITDWHPKNAEDNPSYLRHFLATNDFHIALIAACARTPMTLTDWMSDKELKSTGMKETVTLTSPSGAKHKASVVPDACFSLSNGEGKNATFFVEVDLGTVTIAPTVWERRGWTRKINAYRAYLSSEPYRKRYGDRNVQVLTVTTSEARRVHLQEATEKTGAGKNFWFTIFEQATDPNALLTAPIWFRAGQKDRYSLLGIAHP